MSFGLAHVAPILPAFLETYPELAIDLHLSDALVDLVGGGFDLALRIAALADSSLRARRLCRVRRLLVGSPAYLDRKGCPIQPHDLAGHAYLGYAYLPTPDRWTFVHVSGEEATVTPEGPLRANNGDALTPALRAGLGLADSAISPGCPLTPGKYGTSRRSRASIADKGDPWNPSSTRPFRRAWCSAAELSPGPGRRLSD